MSSVFIFDLETTGLNPYHSKILEIGIKCINNGNEYNTLINHGLNHLDEKIIELTGITLDILNKDGIPEKQAYNGLLQFIINNSSGQDPIYLIAHNGNGFDFIFFKRILKYCNDFMKFEIIINYIDSLNYAQMMMPNQYSFRLKSLCKYFNILNTAEHRAMGDVLALEGLYNVLCDRYKYDKLNPLKLLNDINLNI